MAYLGHGILEYQNCQAMCTFQSVQAAHEKFGRKAGQRSQSEEIAKQCASFNVSMPQVVHAAHEKFGRKAGQTSQSEEIAKQ